MSVLAFMVPAGRHLPIDRAPEWLQNVVYSRYLIATIALMLISFRARAYDRTGTCHFFRLTLYSEGRSK